MEKQNKVGFVIEEELNKKGLLTEVESKSVDANPIEEEGLGSIQKEKLQKQNNEGLLTEEGAESIAEEEGHGGIQKEKSEMQNHNLGGVLIEGLNKKGTNGGIVGDHQSIQQGKMIKLPNSLYLLKIVPSFLGGKEIIPLLYMPSKKNTGLNPNNHTLLDLSKRQVRHSRIYLPELKPGCRICGFSKRWMAVMEGMHIHLLNPFTRDIIQLPHGSELPVIPQNQHYFNINYNGPYYIHKVAILESDNMVVVCALDASGMIFFTRKTDDQWTLCNNGGFFEDIITWQEDKFLGLKENGDMMVFNTGNATLMFFSHVELPNWPPHHTSKCYLAECSDGGLLVISRLILKKFHGKQNAAFYTTKDFQVFKLQGSEWVRKYDLWNSLIFLGVSESRVYEVHHGNTHGYNRIYFSDDHCHRFHHEEELFFITDTGHFTITKSNKIKPFSRYTFSPPSPPLWVGGPAR